MPIKPAAVSYAPQLDGLRAVSVAAVAWSHWLPAYQFGMPLGAGVHLFFVLSGFLITRILLGLRAAPDRPAAVGRFFLRRALRLFPAFYVVLALAWLTDVPRVAASWPWHAAYLSNVYIAAQGAWQGHLSHFWSLAVEQQFYLLWPWLVVWAPSRWLWPSLTAVALVGPVVHVLSAMGGAAEPFWALAPGGSADSLGAGALVAASERGVTRPRRVRAWRWAALVSGACWVAVAVADATTGAPTPVRASRQLLQAIVFGWVVAEAADGVSGQWGRVLTSRPLVAIGRISYGVYLVHAFAPLVIDAVGRSAGLGPADLWTPWARAAGAWAASLAMASLLWHLVEVPASRVKTRTHIAPPAVEVT